MAIYRGFSPEGISSVKARCWEVLTSVHMFWGRRWRVLKKVENHQEQGDSCWEMIDWEIFREWLIIWLVVTGTWLLFYHIFNAYPIDSYFSEGWNHQPLILYDHMLGEWLTLLFKILAVFRVMGFRPIESSNFHTIEAFGDVRVLFHGNRPVCRVESLMHIPK